MALVGDMDEQGVATVRSAAAVLPRRLRPKSGSPLHFGVEGDTAHEYLPYWQVVADQLFTCYAVLAG